MKGKKRKIWIPIGIGVFGLCLFLILFFNIPRLSYTYIEEYDAYYVKKAYGDAKEYVVPQSHKEKEVIGIGQRAFYNHNHLEKITLPESVLTIDRLAFSECEKLKEINLENVDTIYRNAFSYCLRLDNIHLRAENIGASAFFKCLNLKEVVLEEGVAQLGSMAFSETAIESIILPRSVETVEVDCFVYCDSLRKIRAYRNLFYKSNYLKSLDIVEWIDDV